MIIIKVEKKIGRATSVVRRRIESSVNTSSGCRSRFFSTVSIITIDPSTRIPKSIAPNDNRFAGISVTCIRIKAINRDNGMVKATSNAPRQFPKKRISTSTTNTIPSKSVCETVCKVVFTKSVRSINTWMRVPSGNVSLFSSSTAACTPSSTCDGFSPRNIWTIPSTPSEISSVPSIKPNTPLRSKFPYFRRPRSFR